MQRLQGVTAMYIQKHVKSYLLVLNAIPNFPCHPELPLPGLKFYGLAQV